MDETGRSEPAPLDAPRRRRRRRSAPVDTFAIVASLGWLLFVGLFLLSQPRGVGATDSLRFVYTLMALFLPVAMIWVASTASRSSRIFRDESARLEAAVDALRRTFIEDRQARKEGGSDAARLERKLNEIAQSVRKTESLIAGLSHMPVQPKNAPAEAPPDPKEDDGQPQLDIDAAEAGTLPPLTRSLLVRALDFPEDENDEEGFAALRDALQHRGPRQLIQASQDVLSMLSQDGIYMDDLLPDPAPASAWRRFASKRRGTRIVELGGLHDRSSLALTAGRMREDSAFRDAVHEFLRQFDLLFSEFVDGANDDDILDFAETRTARAFVLLGRVTGTVG